MNALQTAVVGSAVVVAVEALVLALGPWTQAARSGGWLGLALVAVSAPLALVMKQWAVRRSMQAAMAAVVLVFFGRLVAVLAGLLVAKLVRVSLSGYVVAFFAGYFALQVVEVRYVLAEWKRLSANGG